MIRPSPKRELNAIQVASRMIRVEVFSNDALEWLKGEATRYGNLYPLFPGRDVQWDLIVFDAFDIAEVRDYLNSYNKQQ